MKIRAITVIWGAAFVDMFLRVALRSLLAEGNLVEVARRHRLRYVIYTTAQDARAIEGSAVFRRLSESVDVRIAPFSPAEIDTANFGSHNDLWKRGVEAARRNGETLFFLIPDVLYAKGTLVSWAEHMERGFRALYTPGPQVVLETFLPEIEAAAARSEALEVAPERIAGLLLRHLHPMHCGMMRDAPRRVPFAEYDVRGVAGRGIVVRELSAQPFCIVPAHFARLVNFSPADHLDDVATLPCSVLSVEPLFKRVEWYYRPWRLDGVRVSQLGSWWDFFAPPGCVKDSATAHDFCLEADAQWRSARKLAEAGGRQFRAQLVVATRIYRLIARLRGMGLERSAEVLAAALFAADLRRRLIVRPGARLLVPANSAYGEAERQALRERLEPGRERALLDLVREHVVAPGTAPPASAAGAGLIAGPVYLEEFEVYVIDQLLLPGRAPSAPAKAASAIVQPAAVPIQFPAFGSAYPARPVAGAFGYSAWADSGSVRRLLYLGLRVPILELAVALPLLTVRGRFRPEIGAALRRLVGLAERIPQLGRAARAMREAHSAGGAREVAALLRVAAVKGLRIRRLGSLLRRAGSRSGALSRRASAVARAAGIRAACRVALGWAGRRNGVLRRLARLAPEAEAAELREVRLARGLLAMEQAYRHYHETSLPRDLVPAPLELIGSILRRNGITAENAGGLLEETLEALLRARPGWLECWLELGQIRQDLGRPQEALKCYLRAARGTSLSASGPRDSRAQALSSSARLLRAEGRLAEAGKSYAASLAIDPGQHAVAVEYANLRREQGHAEESLSLFLAGLGHEETASSAPGAGRDAAGLELPRLARRAGKESTTVRQ